MTMRAAVGVMLAAALVLVGSCSPSSRARFHNDAGQDVEITLAGRTTMVQDTTWSLPFILASGPQNHWDREIRAAGCRYVFREPDAARLSGVQRPALSADAIVLSITPGFTLEVFTQAEFDHGAERKPALSLTAEKTCD